TLTTTLIAYQATGEMDATIAIGDIEFVVKFFSIRITNVPGSSFEGKLCFWLRMRSAIRWNEVGTRLGC
ncbi:MAG: hypothetical protein VCB07_02145, partial [Gammaproteobacteria bacterium]